MIPQSVKPERRKVRYTLLLTPTELELARKLAAREFRTLPDFFRARIHRTARRELIDTVDSAANGKQASAVEPVDALTPEQERAVIEVIKILARRGRALREERERAAQSQTQAPATVEAPGCEAADCADASERGQEREGAKDG